MPSTRRHELVWRRDSAFIGTGTGTGSQSLNHVAPSYTRVGNKLVLRAPVVFNRLTESQQRSEGTGGSQTSAGSNSASQLAVVKEVGKSTPSIQPGPLAAGDQPVLPSDTRATAASTLILSAAHVNGAQPAQAGGPLKYVFRSQHALQLQTLAAAAGHPPRTARQLRAWNGPPIPLTHRHARPSALQPNASLPSYQEQTIARKLTGTQNCTVLYKRTGNKLQRSGVKAAVGGANLTWVNAKAHDLQTAVSQAFIKAETRRRRLNTSLQGREPATPLCARRSAKLVRLGNGSYCIVTAGGRSLKAVESKQTVPQRSLQVVAASLPGAKQTPKQRLASSIVQRSLKSARIKGQFRSMKIRKPQICLEFCKRGKCRDMLTGKCCGIHDPDKVAVCPHWLKGMCERPECPLQHKVKPELMPACIHFLQGTCSNDACPYLHVNVSKTAGVCLAFLNGYCPKGMNCNKKHFTPKMTRDQNAALNKRGRSSVASKASEESSAKRACKGEAGTLSQDDVLKPSFLRTAAM